MSTPTIDRGLPRVDQAAQLVQRRARRTAVLSTLLTSLLIGGVAVFLLYQDRAGHLRMQLESIIELEVAALETELGRMAGLAAQISGRTGGHDQLEAYNRGIIDRQTVADRTTAEFQDAMDASHDILGITRLAADGTHLLSLGSEIPESHGPGAIPGPSGTIGIPGDGHVVIAGTVRNRTMEKLGTDLVVFRDDRLRNIVQDLFARLDNRGSIRLGTLLNGRAYQFYETGQMEQPLDHQALKSELIARLQLGGHDGLHRPEVSDPGKMIMTHGPIGGTQWVLIMQLSPSDLHMPARRQAMYTVLLILLLASVGIALGNRAMQPLLNHVSGENRRLQQMLRRNDELLDKVKANETKLQAVIDNAPAVIYIKDREGRYLLVNSSFEDVVARSREQIIGRYDYEIFPEDLAKSTRDTDLAVFRSGVSLELDETVPQADGTHDYLSIKFPLHDGAGAIYGVCGIASDITERKKAERRLQQSATVFDCTAEAIVITDFKGTVLDVNNAFCDFLGFRRDEVIGRNPRIWKSDFHDEDFYREMWQTIRTQGEWRSEIINRNKSGAATPALATVNTVHDDDGKPVGYVAIYTDVSQLKESQQQLAYLAHHDVLTHLPNRALFQERLGHCLQRADRHGVEAAVIFVDLDHFKQVNDSLGHSHGDQLLIAVAKQLQAAVRSEDTVARIGGDEFTILIEEVRDRACLVTIVEKVLQAFDREFPVGDSGIRITPSLGVSIYPDDGQDATTLMRNADAAMYRAKSIGRNTYQFYTEKLGKQAFRRVRMDNALRNSIAREEFKLLYQPQCDLATGEITGVEALVRWNNAELGEVPPDLFIPATEDNGLILHLGEWILGQACLQFGKWVEQGLLSGTLAVNVSGVQVHRGDLPGLVHRVLDDSGLSPRHLQLEFSERLIMGRSGQAAEILNNLGALGVTLAVDDFGTGYSSLSHLQALPVQRLKIDGSLVGGIPDDPDSAALTRAVIALGNALDLELLAEGVETESQRRFLVEEGCRLGQGYLFHSPVDGMQLERLLDEHASRQRLA